MSIDALRSAIKWAAVHRDEADGLGVDPAEEGQAVAVVKGAVGKVRGASGLPLRLRGPVKPGMHVRSGSVRWQGCAEGGAGLTVWAGEGVGQPLSRASVRVTV